MYQVHPTRSVRTVVTSRARSLLTYLPYPVNSSSRGGGQLQPHALSKAAKAALRYETSPSAGVSEEDTISLPRDSNSSPVLRIWNECGRAFGILLLP